ncbi:phospholipid carrier-dependent glycosyltransferase [Leptospira kemamanensis]|uniref:Phospholipid carrier-dependent glycosyltransferase n=1 Tax=Leptospira kemamanensis TaxID=2484942 RepID=A0A4R9JSX1_9LEPT|nr:phospholipid carrier-dependent glycosyltransferase [Leptospira kemamanensis]TGL52995.1 phospholipid carrier-dependent glycosyltransferase [Leptospira kemamanensis]
MAFLVSSLFLILVFMMGTIIGSPDAPFPQGDEIMHIRSVRESLQIGSVLIPSLSGLPNPYKPPLLFWMGMASDQIFGMSYVSERLVSICFGTGSLLLLYRLVMEMGRSRSEAVLTSLLFGFSFLSLKFFGLLMMEGPMVFFLLIYFYCFYLYQKTKKLSYLFSGSFLSGIGYLLKGPILHVYLILFLFSYFYVKLIRFRKGKLSFQWKHIFQEKWIVYSFALTAIIPLFWILFLYFYVPSGKDLLRFFFITENMGKFYSANQPGLRIWLGWVLYTVPFTIPLLQLVWNSITQKIQTKHQTYVQTVLVFFLLVTSLHLLPNRKDPYYVTPFISFIFLLPAMKGISWQSVLMTKANQISLLLVYFLLVILSMFVRLPYLFGISLLFTVLVASSFCFFQKRDHQWKGILFSQLSLLPIVIFFLLRPMSDPDLRIQTKEIQQESICVVAENPWTAMDAQNKLQNAKIQFSLPLTIDENCRNTQYLINYTKGKVPNEFTPIKSWFHWTQHLDLDFPTVVTSLLKMDSKKFQTEITLWKREETK